MTIWNFSMANRVFYIGPMTFSNYRNGSARVPYDCGVSIEEQLDIVLKKGIEVLFVTNHNTLDGYNQILEYQQNHEKYKKISATRNRSNFFFRRKWRVR